MRPRILFYSPGRIRWPYGRRHRIWPVIDAQTVIPSTMTDIRRAFKMIFRFDVQSAQPVVRNLTKDRGFNGG